MILPNSRAIVLQQWGQCRRDGRMKGRLIRAQTTRRNLLSYKGQAAPPPSPTPQPLPPRPTLPPPPPPPPPRLSSRARAGLLANSGCFVSKCVLWCFVVFCGCFVMFCGCFAVFCECFAVFPQNTQNTRKTSKSTGKHKILTIRSCIAGVFQEQRNSTVLHRTLFTKHLQNTANTPQNSHKTRFVKLCRKTLQNARKTLENVTKRSQYSHNTFCAHLVFSPKIRNTLDLSQKYTIRNIRVNYGGGVTYPQGVT